VTLANPTTDNRCILSPHLWKFTHCGNGSVPVVRLRSRPAQASVFVFRQQYRHGFAATSDVNCLATLGLLNQARELGLGFGNRGFGHQCLRKHFYLEKYYDSMI
jgi:hypothetical protein